MLEIDYYITGVWKNDNKITDVMLHGSQENCMQHGNKVPVATVIETVNKGLVVMALKWDYDTGRWLYIAPLEIIKPNGVAELNCKYSPPKISIQHLLNMGSIIKPQVIVPLIRRKNG